MLRPPSILTGGKDQIADLRRSELRFQTNVTGRENRVIFYCRDCAYQSEPEPWPLQDLRNRQCQKCEGDTSYVAYEQGVEDAMAKRLINTGELPDA